MKPHYLRLSSLALTLFLLLAFGVLWINDTSAYPTVADFEPTYSRQAAVERVAAAQQADAEQRLESVLGLTDASQLPHVPTVYFSPTSHHVSNRSGFLDFWRANGQVRTFGYPITEEIVENGRVVQYFERARFEYHPELAGTPWQVQLGRVGAELFEMRPELAGYQHGFAADPQNGSRYFPVTGHTIIGSFRFYWENRGGVEVFGYPITEQFDENGRLVQYFERARFEYAPENNPYGSAVSTLDVQLSDLGRQVATARGIDTFGVGQMANTAEWNTALWSRRIEVNISTQWLTAYEGELPVFRAPVATGRDGFNTPVGNYAIYDKLSMQTMQGSAGGESWYVPDIPWVMYVVGGVAIHGTYWHNLFGTGTRPSHGCINARIEDAEWLYHWADVGTPVTIHY
jgi:lipoprotein-anchoring transpeptidase ErfK/SrfK